MKRLLILTTLLASPLALAAPSFDCSKANGKVETLICQDAGLMALDNTLAKVYPKALADMATEEKQREKAMQRGWVKGRNDCWKADDLRQCVQTSYQQRITELQIKGGQIMVPSPVNYQCGPMQVSAYFYAGTELPSAVINLDANSPLLAYGVSSGRGAKYEGQNLGFWRKGDEGILSRYGEEDIRCTVRK